MKTQCLEVSSGVTSGYIINLQVTSEAPHLEILWSMLLSVLNNLIPVLYFLIITDGSNIMTDPYSMPKSGQTMFCISGVLMNTLKKCFPPPPLLKSVINSVFT